MHKVHFYEENNYYSCCIILFLLIAMLKVLRHLFLMLAGGSFKQDYYQFEWSIGELSLIGEMTSSNNSFVITNGFIQPFIQYPARDNNNNVFGTDEIKVFPNPASSYVEINFLTKQKGRITLSFYDGTGKKIYTTTDWYYGVGMIKRIPVSKLPNEVYMLHVDLDPDAGICRKKRSL